MQIKFARVASRAADEFRDSFPRVGMEQVIFLLNLRNGAVKSTTASGRGKDRLACGNEADVFIVVVRVGVAILKNIHDVSVAIQARDFRRAVGKFLGIHTADIYVPIVEKFLDLGIVQNSRADVGRNDEIRRRQSFRRQIAADNGDIFENCGSRRVPVRCGRVLRGVGFSVVKTDLFFFGFAGIVGNVLHDAAVRKKRFRRHSFFAATDHFVEILEVLHHKRCLTLSGRQLRIERLAEAALVKVVDRHGALGRDIGRRVAFHVMTFTQYGDAAFAGSNERREFFASAAILHEHVVRCEQIRRFVRREVTIAKEGVQRVELLNEQEHGMRFENV